ncbi:TetR family transcriptional regulator [Actinoplanes sp. SE50]|uniref:TetR/AcrR family transcriptional regulator n=1 Tax=unclassified Actinoplanes TaxID=2626549 RepID=UPI00023EC2F6|nr:MULTISPECIES: TetR/AcrR family transcriptional regulator [unclassified Actinoplanes]AEV85822.1 putative transcriptional regulator, TetR family [Actinoplanes sp. SE50/110]ATO84218.1 TetR family transcriptional regulator [Actinoplanes sp. SE50]SLM01628.1 TetR family transcriptional regulator [Actinoplanes sp. SE50/110]
MTAESDRRRAPGMSTEQRREMIVRAALPLVAEHGAAVTTAQIARAAGIGEATVFRVFTDKNELLGACIVAAMDSTTVLGELRSISVDQPLADRLVEAVDALDAYFARMGAVVGAVHASGTPNRRPGTEAVDPTRPAGGTGDREAARAATRQAVLNLFAPDEATLRVPAATATDAFLALFFGRRGAGRHTPVPDLVDLFLHGAVNTGPA